MPSPDQVAQLLAQGDLAVEHAPLWAAHWLAEGRGGDATGELAGTSRRDTDRITELLPNVLVECDAILVAPPNAAQLQASDVLDTVARLFLTGRASGRFVLERVDEQVDDDPDAVTGQPLAQLYADDAPWRAHNNQAPEIRRRCTPGLRAPAPAVVEEYPARGTHLPTNTRVRGHAAERRVSVFLHAGEGETEAQVPELRLVYALL